MHFQETVPFGNLKTLTYVGFIAAAMFEAAERSDGQRVQMLIALLSVFVEQAAVDGGQLKLAHLLTNLEDPPFAQTEAHRSIKTEFMHGQLADPRWIATQLAYLKDLEQMSDKTSKLVRPKVNSENAQDDEKKSVPKWRAKKPKKTPPAAAEAE